MTLITTIAKRLEDFLNKKKIEKFRIFERIDQKLDAYVFCGIPQQDMQEDLYESFIKECSAEFPFLAEDPSAMKISLTVLSVEDLMDPFYSSIFSSGNGVEKSSKYSCSSFLSDKVKDDLEIDNLPPIVTFYSYKGGMGRTTTMMAYASHLALNEKKRVVVVDCDFEAPGYLNFFDLSKHDKLVSGKCNGLAELLSDSLFLNNDRNLDVRDYAVNAYSQNKGDAFRKRTDLEKITIVPAGNLNEVFVDKEMVPGTKNYLEVLGSIDLSDPESLLLGIKKTLIKIINEFHPDIILFDSRTGFNDVFGTLALYLSRHVVGFFGFSQQTIPGVVNLLKEYYNEKNHFSLQLVYSIIPESANSLWLESRRNYLEEIIDRISMEEKDKPRSHYVGRNEVLELIGTDDESSDEKFLQMIEAQSNEDYNKIFAEIDKACFGKADLEEFGKQNFEVDGEIQNYSSLESRNIVLKHLKKILPNVTNFAEETQEIKEDYFFYRDCMKQFYVPKKFLVQGYKGTGKTFLYAALRDNDISYNIRCWAKGVEPEVNPQMKHADYFVNILPIHDGDGVYPFDNIDYRYIEEHTDTRLYFNRFWQIYTWNRVLLRDEFTEVRNQSQLRKFIRPVSGQKAKDLFDELIEKRDTLGIIEDDFARLNDFLKRDPLGRKLFIMYDRLDTCITPLRWSRAVSPLINFWRNNYATYDCIIPKIFIRTDLFRQIEGTNTNRLLENIISLEWSIEEVFGYLFKLIFANGLAKKAYWKILEENSKGALGSDDDECKNSYINERKKEFAKFPLNQFKGENLREDMNPIVEAFFGKEVQTRYTNLGDPWKYFKKELSNADNSAISLRPFINTLSEDTLDKALSESEKYEIISSQIYASKDVRELATNRYFDDLTADEFSKGLIRFKHVIRSNDGQRYRFKSLDEGSFESLLQDTYSRICNEGGDEIIKNTQILREMIFANGIMAEKNTIRGRYFTFAPIYWYSWGLVNSVLENEDAREIRRRDKEPLQKTIILRGRIEMNGRITRVRQIGGKGWAYSVRNITKYLRYGDIVNGAEVTFVVQKEPNNYDPYKPYYVATEIKLA